MTVSLGNVEQRLKHLQQFVFQIFPVYIRIVQGHDSAGTPLAYAFGREPARVIAHAVPPGLKATG